MTKEVHLIAELKEPSKIATTSTAVVVAAAAILLEQL